LNRTQKDLKIIPLTAADQAQVAGFIREHWGDERVVVHQTVYYPAQLPGFWAVEKADIVGLVTYQVSEGACEIVSLDSLKPAGNGVGSALVEAVKAAAVQAGCRRLWLVTTNDNLNALRFYQRRGFYLRRVTPDAVSQARFIKPSIPLVGDFNIPIRDEIELDMNL
jgi:DNA-3-methyladenine glycosylase I